MESTKPMNERKCLMFDREGKSGLPFKQGSQGRAVLSGKAPSTSTVSRDHFLFADTAPLVRPATLEVMPGLRALKP